jgi:hypothetical protein
VAALRCLLSFELLALLHCPSIMTALKSVTLNLDLAAGVADWVPGSGELDDLLVILPHFEEGVL